MVVIVIGELRAVPVRRALSRTGPLSPCCKSAASTSVNKSLCCISGFGYAKTRNVY